MEGDLGTIDSQIDEVIRMNKIHRYALELQYTTDDDQKKSIKAILSSLDGSKQSDSRDKLNKICDEFDNNALKKKWFRLKDVQKKDRLKEYIKRTKYKDGDKVLEMLASGKLDNKMIQYDDETCQIISIKSNKKKV